MACSKHIFVSYVLLFRPITKVNHLLQVYLSILLLTIQFFTRYFHFKSMAFIPSFLAIKPPYDTLYPPVVSLALSPQTWIYNMKL